MQFDFIVIGAGIAGASAGYELAAKGKVAVLEREARPGYHTTGRSAATFIETYGPRPMRLLTSAGKAFFQNPPFGFCEHALVVQRGSLVVGNAGQAAKLAQALAETRALSAASRGVDTAEALRLCPVLKPEACAAGMLDPDAMDIDVDALHQGFLRGLRARGGQVVTDAEVLAIDRANGQWQVRTPAGGFAAPVVVNAAGAWADRVGALAGAARIGLVPKRRTIVAFDPPDGVDSRAWPIVSGADEDWYFLRQGGRLIGSPADETPSEPCDAQPEELDVAIAIDRIETATTLRVRRVAAKWAGLRSFVADKVVVAGFAPEAEGFFWLAGQGGYGIQTAPALARAVAGLIGAGELPADLRARGLAAAMLAPDRPALRQVAAAI